MPIQPSLTIKSHRLQYAAGFLSGYTAEDKLSHLPGYAVLHDGVRKYHDLRLHPLNEASNHHLVQFHTPEFQQHPSAVAFRPFAFSDDGRSLLQLDAASRSLQEAHAFSCQALSNVRLGKLYPIRLCTHDLGKASSPQTFFCSVQVPRSEERRVGKECRTRR